MKKEKCELGSSCDPKCSTQEEISDFDFDISRTFGLLTAVLVVPLYLSLSVVSYSMLALI